MPVTRRSKASSSAASDVLDTQGSLEEASQSTVLATSQASAASAGRKTRGEAARKSPAPAPPAPAATSSLLSLMSSVTGKRGRAASSDDDEEQDDEGVPPAAPFLAGLGGHASSDDDDDDDDDDSSASFKSASDGEASDASSSDEDSEAAPATAASAAAAKAAPSNVAQAMLARLSKVPFGLVVAPKQAVTVAGGAGASGLVRSAPSSSSATSSSLLQRPHVMAALRQVATTTFGDSQAVSSLATAAPTDKPAGKLLSVQGYQRSHDGGKGVQHAFTPALASHGAASAAAASPRAPGGLLISMGGVEGVGTGVAKSVLAGGGAGGAAAAAAVAGGAGSRGALAAALSRTAAISDGAGLATEGSTTAPLVRPPKSATSSSASSSKGGPAKDAGKNWYNLPRQELTDEIKRDLLVLRHRAYADPKRFYKTDGELKKNKLPEFFQVGTVVSGAFDGTAGKLPRAARATTLVDAMLMDDAFQKFAAKNVAEVNAKGVANSAAAARRARMDAAPAWKQRMANGAPPHKKARR